MKERLQRQVIRSNGSIDLVGKTGLVTVAESGLLFAGYLMRLRVDLAKALPAFIQIDGFKNLTQLTNQWWQATWRICKRTIERYKQIDNKPKGKRSLEEKETLKEAREELVAMSKASSEFAVAVRCCLFAKIWPQTIGGAGRDSAVDHSE